MKQIVSKLSLPSTFFYILILGILLRLFFVFYGGKIYYGKADYFTQGDTPTWFNSFVNLANSCTYTVNPDIENGKFFRPPGYSFLFGIFYLLTFKNYILASKLLVILQVLMDVFSVWLVQQIAFMSVKEKDERKKIVFGNSAALLFAVYPFVIVWAPVLYAETSSLFFLLMSVFFSLRLISGKNSFLSGVFGGIAALIRLQCIFALPLLCIAYLFQKVDLKRKITVMAFFGFGVLITYGLWPARNYFLHDRIIFSQDLNIGKFWSKDYMAFMDYVYSVRTDHTPVYRSLIQGEKVNWPAASYLSKRDSILLDSVSVLCNTCGTGFSYFMVQEGVRSTTVAQSINCDSSIAAIFNELRDEQRKQNGLHYWLTVPLGNFQKCFFKFSIYGNKSTSVKLISSFLFIFRTLFILLGFYGIFLGLKNKFFEKGFGFFVLSYPIIWYFYLSFFYRNMEIRYLLHTDVLLLIPAAFVFVSLIFNKYQKAT
ncbi:MAG: hypothetical protein NTV09_06265 [Bacteroidetes bacterium]|nr:hypothetical protein [Bacteroidota bacterium]